MADVEFIGGKKLQELFRKGGKGGIKSVDIGVFDSAKYPDGTPVAVVAVWNEFGTTHIRERPAIRMANKENEKDLIRIIRKTTDPEKMVITKRQGGIIGSNHQGAIQKSITKLKLPSNDSKTIRMKGSSNPLIADGFYKNSITFKVIP